MGLAEPAQLLPQARGLVLPAAEPDVGVVALRKHPAVAAGDDPELEHGAAPVAVAQLRVGDVPFERDADRLVPAEAERPGADAVDAVGADESGSVDLLPVDGRRHTLRARGDRRHLAAVAKLGAREGGLLGQVRIEPDSLGHEDERRVAAVLEPAAVAKPHPHGGDRVLDHRRDREGELARRSSGDAAAARLVAREARPVEQEHGGARAGQAMRARRACRPGAHDDHVVAGAPRIMSVSHTPA